MALAGLADAQSLKVVNAASFLENQALTPGSIISIFGTQIAISTAQAGDPEHLPVQLGDVTVKIGNTPLALFYTSPSQVNAMIPSTIAAGSFTLTLVSGRGTFSSPVTISPAGAPGIFSIFGTGTRDGAILNALTFSPGPFTVTTHGAPTYLAIYVTGLDLSAAPAVRIGGVAVPVSFYGAAPCCAGLEQINVELPKALAGAGRVEVAVTAAGAVSNVVEAVILPSPGEGDFPPSGENVPRDREIAEVRWIPGTSQALVSDEADDVLRVVDLQAKQVSSVIDLPTGSEPTAIAVNPAGTLAVVAERNNGGVAVIDLARRAVIEQIPTGGGPSAVAIAGNIAVVANEDSDTASLIDLTSGLVKATIVCGRGPRGVAVDAANSLAYVTEEDGGALTVIDLAGMGVSRRIDLGVNSRPRAIALMRSLGLALVSEPSGEPEGTAVVINLADGSVSSTGVHLADGGSAGTIAVDANTAFFADQTGASVTAAAVSLSGGAVSLAQQQIKVDLGPRSLAIDRLDNLLLVSNEGDGTIVLVSLANYQIVGRIDAVHVPGEPESEDDHNDRGQAPNEPSVTSVAPSTIAPGSQVTLVLYGANLAGATGLAFVDPSTLPGNGKGRGNGHSGDHAGGPFANSDPAFTVSAIAVNAAGTRLSAVVNLAAQAQPGTRVVRVITPNGESSFVAGDGNAITISGGGGDDQ